MPAQAVQISMQPVGLAEATEAAIKLGVKKGLAGFDSRGLQGAFGNLTQGVRAFDAALDRANQRVLLFGTSAGTVYGAIKLFKDLVTSTIAVEKSMTNINAVLGLTNRQLDQFTKGMFNVAVNTSQSFEKVSDAAEEFARQGLSAAETLKRTQDAMVLARVAAISTADAVTALTSAVNGFQKEGLTTSQVVNRLTALSTAFAVSTKDLEDGLVRAGASAADVGVSFNQLIGLIATAKQATGRDGAAIAQSLNLIFTRLNTKGTLDQIQSLGVVIKDLKTGAILPTIQILENFSSAYDHLTGSARNAAAELLGGTRNLDNLKAVLNDLSRSNSTFADTQRVAASATDRAFQINEAYNRSLEATITRAQTVQKQIFANVGNVGFAGPAKSLINGFTDNPVTDALRDASGQAETAGGQVAQTFIKGFGNAVLFGLGPIVIKGLYNILSRTAGNVFADFKFATGLTSEEEQQKAIQSQIVGLYQTGSKELLEQLATTTSLIEKARIYRATLEAGAATTSAIQAEISATASIMQEGGYSVPRRPRALAGGYIPYGAEASAIAQGVGGAPASAKPVLIPNFAFGGGVNGPIVANTSEFIVPNMAGGGSAIYNRDMVSRLGLPPGAKPIAAGGYIPNAAGGLLSDTEVTDASRRLGIAEEEIRKAMTLSSQKLSELISQTAEEYSKAVGSGKTVSEISDLKIQERGGLYRSLFDRAYAGNNTHLGPLGNLPMQLGSEYGLKLPPQDIEKLQGLFDSLRKASSVAEASKFGPQIIDMASSLDKVSERGVLKEVANTFNNLTLGYGAKISRGGLGAQPVPQGSNIIPGAGGVASYTTSQFSRLQANGLIDSASVAGGTSAIPSSLFSRIRSSINSPIGRFGAGLGLTFLAGTVPEGQGGTDSGRALGALGSGVTGAGIGLQFGGGLGAAAGLAIGGLYGYISKFSKSIDELAKDIDDGSKKLKQSLDSASSTFDTKDQITEALKNGDTGLASSLNKQLSSQIAALPPKYRALVESNINNPNGRNNFFNAANPDVISSTNQGNLQLGLAPFQSTTKLGLDTIGLGSYNEQQKSNAIASIIPFIKDLSQTELVALQKQNTTDPNKVLATIGGRAGLTGSNLNSFTKSSTYTQNAVTDAIHSVLNVDPKAALGRLQSISGQVNLEKSLTDLAQNYKVLSNFASITFAADKQIEGVKNQIALSNPLLTDVGKLTLQGQQGASDITTRIAAQRTSELYGGKGSLAEAAGKSGYATGDTYKTIDQLNSLSGAQNLLASLRTDSGRAANPGLGGVDFLKALNDLIRKLKDLDQTERENTRANDESTKAKIDELEFMKTRAGAASEYQGAANRAGFALTDAYARNDTPDIIQKLTSESKLATIRANYQSGGIGSNPAYYGSVLGVNLEDEIRNRQNQGQGVQSLLKTNPSLLSGGQTSSALFGLAQNAGQTGGSAGALPSLVGGFTSQFAGLKQDLNDLSSVGKSVADSISANLGKSFSTFVTGAKSGQDAFRSFITSVLNDSATAFADKSMQELLGLLLGNLATSPGGATASLPAAVGNAGSTLLGGGSASPLLNSLSVFGLQLAGGGSVPAMLTGGEYVFTPQQAHNIGVSNLRSMNMGGYQGFAGGGMVRGGTGMKDDVATRLAPGSYVMRKSMVQKYGADYLSSLASGGVQHRALGGFILPGALIGGLLGYLAGGKKGALTGLVAGAGLGALGNYLGSSAGGGSGSFLSNTAAGATASTTAGSSLSIGQKLLFSAGAAGILGGASAAFGPPGAVNNPAANTATRQSLEAWQQANPYTAFNGAQQGPGQFPFLSIGPQGQTYIKGYTDAPATRTWAGGGLEDGIGADLSLNGGSVTPVTTPSAPNVPSRGGATPQVQVQITIHNNGSTSATASSNSSGGGFDADAAQRLQKTVQGWVQQELVNQSRPDGFFAQKGRFINR